MNDKRNCDIAQDLIPLEIDGVCTDGSREFLQEHMQECESCRRLHEVMTKNSSWKQPKENKEENALRRSMKRARVRMLAVRIALALLAVAIVALIVPSLANAYWQHTEFLPISCISAVPVTQEAGCPRISVLINRHAAFIHSIDMQVEETGDGIIAEYQLLYYDREANAAEKDSKSGYQPFPKYEFLYDPLMDGYTFVVKGGQIYTRNFKISGGPGSAADIPLDMPVLEIRVTDGTDTLVLYKQGDELPDSAWLSLATYEGADALTDDADTSTDDDLIPFTAVPTPTPEA